MYVYVVLCNGASLISLIDVSIVLDLTKETSYMTHKSCLVQCLPLQLLVLCDVNMITHV